MFYPILLLAAAVSPVSDGSAREAVLLHAIDTRPASLAAARRTVARIAEAAMAVCGASGSSLREIRLAVRASACWRDSMADARRQLADPLLRRAWPDTDLTGDRP